MAIATKGGEGLKRLIKLANVVDDIITRVALYTGLAFLLVIAVASFAYVTAEAQSPSMDLSGLVSGTKVYLWIALPPLWAISKAFKWGLRLRNWWVHTDEHRLKILPKLR